ncbi:MAG: CotH kinase family protein [Nitritalea sp.]
MKKKFLPTSRHALPPLMLAVLALLFTACQEPLEKELPKGDDEQVFALDVGDSEIPYLVISSESDIPFEPKVPGSLKVYQKKKLVQEQRIGIEYRGKTSFRLSEKKGFNIETVDDAGNSIDVAFFGMPELDDWRIVGHVVNVQDNYIWDKSLMYNPLGYALSRSIGRYAARSQFVEIEVNGVYMGVYAFMERLKRGRDRIDIRALRADSENISGGYLLTIDKSSIGEAGIGLPLSYFYNNWDDDARYTAENSFRSHYDILGQKLETEPFGPPYHPNMYRETYFLYDYPRRRNTIPAHDAYIQNYIHAFETALSSDDFSKNERSYLDYIEIESFVDYFILNELCRNVDAYRISTYLQKDRDGKLAMGPIWDMNIGFDEGERIPMNTWVMRYNDLVGNDPWMVPFWWPRLMEDSYFRAVLKERWTHFRRGPLTDQAMLSLVDSFADYLVSNGAVKRNYELWDQGIGVNYEESIEALKQFLKTRASWMDSEIASL